MSEPKTYPVSRNMEQALNEIRFLMHLAESHHAGIKSISFKMSEHDGAVMSMNQEYSAPTSSAAGSGVIEYDPSAGEREGADA